MTTTEALEQLMARRGWYLELGFTEPKATSMKRNFKSGKMTLDKMEEILGQAGFKIIQEKLWSKP